MNKDYLKGGQREAGRTEPGAVEGASEASQRPSGTLEAGVLFACRIAPIWSFLFFGNPHPELQGHPRHHCRPSGAVEGDLAADVQGLFFHPLAFVKKVTIDFCRFSSGKDQQSRPQIYIHVCDAPISSCST